MGRNQFTNSCVIATETTPFLSLAAPRTEGGQPVQRFRKELIRTGNFRHPTEGFHFTVTTSDLDNWALQFGRMDSAGVKIPVPTNHTTDPEKNRGWLRGAFREGNSLIGIIDLVGADAIAMAGRSDVSLYSPPEFVDGKNNVYKWPITHVALCTDPVVPGLTGFIPLAASLGSTPVNVPVFTDHKEAPSMALNLETLQKALGIESALTDDNAEAAIVALFTGLTKTLKDSVDAVETLTAQLVEAKATKPAGEPAGEPAIAAAREVNPELLRLSRENHDLRLNQLVEGGRITPAVRTKLQAAFIGKDGAALKLSLSTGTNEQFGKVLDALADNDPVVLREQTGRQTLELSRNTDSKSPLVADAEARAKAAHA